jgi:hypothetical protein
MASKLPDGVSEKGAADQLRMFVETIDQEKLARSWRQRRALKDGGSVDDFTEEDQGVIDVADDLLCARMTTTFVEKCPELTPGELKRWLVEDKGWNPDAADEMAYQLESALEDCRPTDWASVFRKPDESERQRRLTRLEVQVRALYEASPELGKDYEAWMILREAPARSTTEEKTFRRLDRDSFLFREFEGARALAPLLGVDWADFLAGLRPEPTVPIGPPDRREESLPSPQSEPSTRGRRLVSPWRHGLSDLSWPEVHIRILSEAEELEFSARNRKKTIPVCEFAPRRKTKPVRMRSRMYDLLLQLAFTEGRGLPKGAVPIPNLKRVAADLRRRLRAFMGIPHDPLSFDGTGYVAAFKISLEAVVEGADHRTVPFVERT